MPCCVTQESVKQNEALFCVRTELLTLQQKQYESVNRQRVKLQDSIKSQVEQCNEIIQTENGVFRDVQQSTAKKGQTEAALQRMNNSLETGGGLVTSYNSFIRQTVKYIARINKTFEHLWHEFESGWMAWTVDDVAAWFKHKTGDLGKNEDWTVIASQLRERKIAGKSLQQFNALMFELFGFNNSKVIDLLVSELKNLKKRYGADEEVSASEETAKKNLPEIPKVLLCPITHKIMLDPVFAAVDGHSYERSAIEE